MEIQNICCRIILRKGLLPSTDEMHQELNLLRLETRRDPHVSELCDKNIYYDTHASLYQFFELVPERNNRETRQRNL